jgi:hypothetical protein
MGEAELDESNGTLVVHSNIICYGGAATEDLARQLSEEIRDMWNEPGGTATINGQTVDVRFAITPYYRPSIDELEILGNTDPRNNYFRIEEFALGNISFVDALGCNTGYFKLENLYPGSTTAAHEYGHTLGLEHPANLDLRGKGVPGIMYPRGTLVDPQFQYDPLKPAGVTGGTMHPMYRKVKRADIASLQLGRKRFSGNKAILGDFTNIYHWDHRTTTGQK